MKHSMLVVCMHDREGYCMVHVILVCMTCTECGTVVADRSMCLSHAVLCVHVHPHSVCVLIHVQTHLLT